MFVYHALEHFNERIRKQTGGKEALGHVGIVSSGNAALSLAMLLEPTRYRLHVLLTQTSEVVRSILEDAGADVRMTAPGEWVRDAAVIAQRCGLQLPEHLFGVTMGFHDAYRSIVLELSEQMREPPTSIICPFGTGEAALGMMKGVEELGWDTRMFGIHRTADPHIGGTLLDGGIAAWMDGGAGRRKFEIVELDAQLTESQILASVPEGIRSESSAAVPFAWLKHQEGERSCREFPDCAARFLGDRVVVVNSGYGVLTEKLSGHSETTAQ